jgi:SAM-dependent methyltransferase
VTSHGGGPSHAVRSLFARHLIGTGLELGALHNPYPVTLPAVETRYVDRWTPDEARDLFPELARAEFTAADHISDLNLDRLSMIPDGSQDFVVACHVLEHVANPLALLVDMHRVLRPGGVALVMLPDMRRTSDFRRAPTTAAHLAEEYERDVRDVDLAHLEEYARLVMNETGEGPEFRAYLDRLAQRSIHVHAWSEPDFFAALRHAVDRLGCRFELVELLETEEYEKNIEFGYVLRRTTADVPDEALARRLSAQRELLVELRAARGWLNPEAERRMRELHARIRRSDRRIAQLERRVERHESWLRPLRRSPVWPALRLARRVWSAAGAPRPAARPVTIPLPREPGESEPAREAAGGAGLRTGR